jgi:hypothetical protein
MFIDLMIPVKRAIPAEGTKVYVRFEDKSSGPAIFTKGKFRHNNEQNVISWIHNSITNQCKCTKLKKVGKCKNCGTKWKKIDA